MYITTTQLSFGCQPSYLTFLYRVKPAEPKQVNCPCPLSPQPSVSLCRLVLGPSHPLLTSLSQWDEFGVSREFLEKSSSRALWAWTSALLAHSPACWPVIHPPWSYLEGANSLCSTSETFLGSYRAAGQGWRPTLVVKILFSQKVTCFFPATTSQ